MKLKEQEVLQSVSEEKFISPPPIFDFDKVEQAREIVEKMKLGRFSALKVALSLQLYNKLVENSELSEEKMQRLARRFIRLTNTELEAALPRNPLPTIGFEVESPTKPQGNYFEHTYGAFFDFIGMPRNKINSRSTTNYSQGKRQHNVWEFSPPPSYSAHVQARILSELIRGRFIPSLTFSKNPSDIYKYLDGKLVSLHINLGIPEGVAPHIYSHEVEIIGARRVHTKSQVINDEVRFFPVLFALAHTSAQRLAAKRSQSMVMLKPAEQTIKNKKGGQRLEVKALEVRDSDVYRLMEEIQLVGAAFFTHLHKKNHPLADRWEDLQDEAGLVFREYNITPEECEDEKGRARAAEVVQQGIASELRPLIKRSTFEISQLIKTQQQDIRF